MNKIKKLCIIPGRGGSKRFHGKNMALIGDRPLIYHTYTTVKDYFDKIIISTDCEKIMNKLAMYPVNINKTSIIKRPDEFATDESRVIDTVIYYFDKYGKDFDQIWLCLPTCPLRSKEDVEGAQDYLDNEKGIDGVVGVTDVEFPVSLSFRINDKKNLKTINEIDKKNWLSNNSRSQDHVKTYRPNGAFYGMWCDDFKNNKNFFKGVIGAYYMPRKRSIDIDTDIDLIIANAILKGENSIWNNSI